MIEKLPTCDLCGTCVGVCPELALEMSEKELHFYGELCTYCLKCVRICPMDALKDKRERKTGKKNEQFSV